MTPLRSAVITTVSSLLRASPPLHSASLLSVLSFCDLHLFDSHLRAGSRVPYTGLLRAHAILMPDAEQPASGLPLSLSRSGTEIPVLTSLTLTTLHQWFTCVHLHGAYLPIFIWTFPCLAESSAHVRICGFCSSARNFAHWRTFQPPQSGFLQIPPRDEHPCLRLTVPATESVVVFHHQTGTRRAADL